MATVVPDKASKEKKKQQVEQMFDNISPYYDFLNHLLSFGIDIIWRNKAIAHLKQDQPQILLDVATGTADFAIQAMKLKPRKIIGVDISAGMLEKGIIKIRKKGLQDRINLQQADSEDLPFADGHFDAAMVAFGVRNFENLDKGLSEIHRVLKPGGKLAVLEFSQPPKFPVRQLYKLYFMHVLPAVGRLVSKNSRAYDYLPESVYAFPSGKDFENRLELAGFVSPRTQRLTFGIASVYTGIKK
ncbi:MAG: bifunctional demethylmenaquinone methyltransferase/2-methoxy-6-polyprenyl-1,4-benzoquinol methylase UbiE [Bacteroidia bacterium]